MTSKYHHQSSRRHPLKRVRPDNENQSSIPPSNGRVTKKLCRQPSEDSAFVEIEKSSDERAFDLFYKEYFSQFRPYFKYRSVALQFTEHLWTNMIESSKVAFVKKILKEQGLSDISSASFNDENDSRLSRSFHQSNDNILTLNSNNKYSRGFINDFLSYLKHSTTPRFVDITSSVKLVTPLRRSSRVRRAPIKCVCSTCITTGAVEEHSYTNEHLEYQVFRDLINHYQQLDDQYLEKVNEHDTQAKLDETNDNQVQMVLAEIVETETSVRSSPAQIAMISMNSEQTPAPAIDLSIDFNEKSSLVRSDSLATNECPMRRTFVILTELDEPFFGPYPIEFTITI